MNLVLFYIGITVLCWSTSRILQRYILKETEPYAFAFMTQVVGLLLFAPIALRDFSIPTNPSALLFLIIAGLLWAVITVSSSISYKKTEVSLQEPISQSRIIWVFILGTLFLGEIATLQRVIGTIVVFLGVTLLLYHPERPLGRLSDPGVRWALFTSFMFALVSVVDKLVLRWFSPNVYAFLAFAMPAVILSLFLPRRMVHVKHLLKTHGGIALTAILISAIGYYFSLRAYAIADITFVFPLLQLTSIATVVGGIIILREREHILQRVIAIITVIIGSLLLKI